ncbi:MAG: DUF4249 domain-containing protein [Gemmatimonadaceae bacterium]|nr:DUF4249 domain-containing protein [Chitinophagaceae bacterium]
MIRSAVVVVCLFAAVYSCKDKYEAPVSSPKTGYLVVEGVINAGTGPTIIMLGRSVPLPERTQVKETGALVQVEGSNSSVVTLTEVSNGVYRHAQLTLANGVKYRLKIKTMTGNEYVSEFQDVKITPVIDSVSWTRDAKGVDIFIHAQDAQNKTRYYKWEFEETWQYHSRFSTFLRYKVTPIPNRPPLVELVVNDNGTTIDTIYKCWQGATSTEIEIGSTAKLSQDRVYLPIQHIEQASLKLSVLYSIYVNQTALSKRGYEFFERMKKNSESVGSVFDPQPSEIRGNIVCTNDPSEIVIGFVEVSSTVNKRVFIDNRNLPGWGYRQSCVEPITILNNPDSVLASYFQGQLPVGIVSTKPNGSIDYYAAAEGICVDCTLRGSNKKPPFWP